MEITSLYFYTLTNAKISHSRKRNDFCPPFNEPLVLLDCLPDFCTCTCKMVRNLKCKKSSPFNSFAKICGELEGGQVRRFFRIFLSQLTNKFREWREKYLKSNLRGMHSCAGKKDSFSVLTENGNSRPFKNVIFRAKSQH